MDELMKSKNTMTHMEALELEVAALDVSTPPRRSGRKRIFTEPPPTPPAKSAKRKGTRPILTNDSLKKFYMNKTSAKFARQGLETIYEDPTIGKNGQTLLTGVPKIKRAINMASDLGAVTKLKKIGRKKRIKRLGISFRLNKLSNEDFKKRLKLVDAYLAESATTSNVSATDKTDADSTQVLPMEHDL